MEDMPGISPMKSQKAMYEYNCAGHRFGRYVLGTGTSAGHMQSKLCGAHLTSKFWAIKPNDIIAKKN